MDWQNSKFFNVFPFSIAIPIHTFNNISIVFYHFTHFQWFPSCIYCSEKYLQWNSLKHVELKKVLDKISLGFWLKSSTIKNAWGHKPILKTIISYHFVSSSLPSWTCSLAQVILTFSYEKQFLLIKTIDWAQSIHLFNWYKWTNTQLNYWILWSSEMLYIKMVDHLDKR